jgi:hypothetical protein
MFESAEKEEYEQVDEYLKQHRFDTLQAEEPILARTVWAYTNRHLPFQMESTVFTV